MGRNLDKFILLMWKNWLLEYRHPLGALLRILVPIFCFALLVLIRSSADSKHHDTLDFKTFCTIPVESPLVKAVCKPEEESSKKDASMDLSAFSLIYSPKSGALDKVMNVFRQLFKEVIQLDDSGALIKHYEMQSNNMTFAAIEFDDSYKDLTDLKTVNNFKVSLRFPGETRFELDPENQYNWKTNLIYPHSQSRGPRQHDLNEGGAPSYYKEGFLAIQHILTLALIFARKDTGTTIEEIISSLSTTAVPVISMRRYPHPEWYEDNFTIPAIQSVMTIIMICYLCSFNNIVTSITMEKEKQLKESMKIMGLPNWLHWTAWFLKCFISMFISAIVIVILLKVKLYKNTDMAVVNYGDATVVLFLLFCYICSTIALGFAVSVLFSKASTAAALGELIWLVTVTPMFIMIFKQDAFGPSAKLVACLFSNTAAIFGFQIVMMFEGTGDGVQWNNLFTSNKPDDSLSLGLVIVMLLVDTFIFLFITLYVEAVFPGEYGVPLPWYFLFTSSYWHGSKKSGEEEPSDADPAPREFFESEPQNLQKGVEIKNLGKKFKRKTAVQNLSLNMYENQITVLLGHNGAGKTTTISMLTGMITPTSGTAKVNGYDIRTEMNGVRESLGLCPQHDIIFDELTVAEHIYFFSKLKGLPRKEINAEINKYVQLLELEDKKNSRSSTLSGGMKRKLCVGMALCGNSKVVMLDEPTSGMDPSARRALWDFLLGQKEGRTMLLTTHFMDEADLLGDRIAIMAGGELQCCGSSFFLKKKYGTGYTLIIDKSKDCDPGQVTQLLRNHIRNIEINSNVGSELTYKLIESQSSLFEPMLKDLENSSNRLGVRGYGISLTTLEEVFLKVGAIHTKESEDVDNADGITHNTPNRNMENEETRINTGLHAPYKGGLNLLMNQFLAMLMKKFLSMYRSWIILIVQIFLPALFLIIILATGRAGGVEHLPALPLSLNKFRSPVVLMGDEIDSSYAKAYSNVLKDLSYDAETTDNVTGKMLKLTDEKPTKVRTSYIVGASFDKLPTAGTPHITAWFNNDAYHSAPISLSLVLNAMFRQVLDCNDCSITFKNHPLPFTAETQVKMFNVQSMGNQFIMFLTVSLLIGSSLYVLFVIKENVTNSKHLQFVSGVNVLVFWLTSALCDMFTYIVAVLVALATLLAFQEDGFKTAENAGVVFVILFYFGWAVLPLVYIFGCFFRAPATGFSAVLTLGYFMVLGWVIVMILSLPNINKDHIARTLHWIFLLIPYYSLISGITDYQKFFSYKQMCSECINDICSSTHPLYDSTCKGIDESYYRWESPGIGRNMVFSFVGGIVLFLLLLGLDLKIFSRIIYRIAHKFFPKQPTEIEDEDDDVAEERQKIKNATQQELLNNYTLVIRDLTKYYKKFLAVNSLCLGLQKYECFGLLGVNGAGKTTTFKMLTGDVSISYGDGWVNGFSIKSQIKKAQKSIGYCPQFDALLDDITCRETIIMFALIRGIRYSDCKELPEILAREFDFLPHLDKKVKQLSGGSKRKLSTAISLIGDSSVIYLDEPTTGMDPASKRYIWDALSKNRDSGKCVILTSHSMEECEALCTRLAIMVNGQFKCLGSTQHLKNKFAKGYTFTIRLKKLEDPTQDTYDTGPVEDYIRRNFPEAKLREKHQDLLDYYVTDKSIPSSRMFGILEKAKRAVANMQDYSLGQSSLEQVFLTFTKRQN